MLLALAVVLGGGGAPVPLTELVVQLGTLLILGLAIVSGLRPLRLARQDRPLAILLLAILALPLLQLTPLPAALWTQLPGRDAATSALTAIGAERRWQAWSMLPDNTAAAALALIPAIVVTVLVARLAERDRVKLIGAVVLAGLIAALLGLVQFIRGADHLISLYADVHRGWSIGFFANRNAQADLLAIALIAGVLLADHWRDRLVSAAWAGVGIVLLILLMSSVATGSRMGIALLIVPVLLALGLTGRRAPWLAAGIAGATALLLVGGTALDRVTARVGDGGNRAEIWGDSLFLARETMPTGAGMGSFVPLYAAVERLDHVQPTIANRAHNDWLELTIEGGVPALALAATVLAFVAIRAARGWRDPDPDRRLLARFAGLTALVLAVHSTVDYPLRTLTLLTIAGLALGGLASRRLRPHGPDGDQVAGGPW